VVRTSNSGLRGRGIDNSRPCTATPRHKQTYTPNTRPRKFLRSSFLRYLKIDASSCANLRRIELRSIRHKNCTKRMSDVHMYCTNQLNVGLQVSRACVRGKLANISCTAAKHFGHSDFYRAMLAQSAVMRQ